MDDQFTFDDEPEMTQLKRTFDRAVARLKVMMPPVQFDKFIKPLEVVGREGHLVLVAAPGKFVTEWVNDKYRKQLEEALSEEGGQHFQIVLEARLKERGPDDRSTSMRTTGPIVDSPSQRLLFENFVVGDSNRIACKGFESVAANPGKFCNPLYVFGPTGVGKTHLAWAAHNRTRSLFPSMRTEYMTAHEFGERFVVALKAGTIPQFHRSFDPCKLLIIDDIAFVERGTKFQEELFHLFNAMIHEGRQLVLCSDRPPRELSIDERLRSRMESGLVADILPPDTALRTQIVKRKGADDGIELDDEVCELLASSVPGNVRPLLGALKTLLIHAGIMGVPPCVNMARSVITKQFGCEKPTVPTADQIIEVVAKDAGVSRDDIIGASRRTWVALPRHLAMYLIREEIGESWKRIGARFGNRDHSSIIHAHRKMTHLLLADPDLQERHRRIRRNLGLDRD